MEVLLQQQHNSHLQPKNSSHPHKTGLGRRTVDSFSYAPKHLDIAGTDEPNARLLAVQRKLNTNFSLVATFLTRKFKEVFITSKTVYLQPNERYLSLSRLRLLKHQTRSPATCLVATQLQDRFMKANSISKKSPLQLRCRAFLPNS